MMKGIAHYLWESRLLHDLGLRTTDGKSLHILQPGRYDERRALFCEAKVKIGDEVWCGDIMLHNNAHTGKEVGTTVLNIFLNDTARAAQYDNGTAALNIECPEELVREFNAAEQHTGTLPCTNAITKLQETQLCNNLSQLLAERIEEKRKIIERIFVQCDQRWDDTLLKVAIRSFGFGIQSQVFEEWARVLNTQALGKHHDNLTQIEAMLFGQAGLLEDESIPYYYRENALKSDYYNELKREYRFLSNKFSLKSIDHKIWGNNSTPHLRIARIAGLYHLNRLTISGITAAETLTEVYRLFSHQLSGYWQNHTCFGGTETSGNGCLRQRQVDVIIINSIVPMLHIYGKHRKEERLCERALELLYRIEAEENSIIRKWREQGIRAHSAADSQALLQLERCYCRTRSCTDCIFAYHYIKSRITDK